MGVATAGHVAAMKRAGSGIKPIFAQQSIREMTRTNRSPEQVMSDAVNGANLRCEYDDNGVCIKVNPCHGDFRTSATDDCLAPVEERAWSSPIFVNYAQ